MYGAIDLPGTVDLPDFTYLAANFNKQSGAVWLEGDYNYDDKVDLTDFTFLASNLNQTLAEPPPGVGAIIPEPGSMLLAASAIEIGRASCRERVWIAVAALR